MALTDGILKTLFKWKLHCKIDFFIITWHVFNILSQSLANGTELRCFLDTFSILYYQEALLPAYPLCRKQTVVESNIELS